MRVPSSVWLPAFLGGFLLGGLAGAVAALMLAPRSGEKTRSQIQKQSAKMFEQAADSMEEIVAEAGDKAGQFTDGVQKGVGDLQKSAQNLFVKGGSGG